MSKIPNSRTIPEWSWKRGFFQEHFQNQKKSRTIQGIQGIPEPLGTLKLCLELHASHSFFYSTIPAPPAPQTKGSSQLSRKFPNPLAPSKAKFETFQLSPVSIGGGRGDERGYKGSHYGSLWAPQPMRNLDEIFNIFWLSVYM